MSDNLDDRLRQTLKKQYPDFNPDPWLTLQEVQNLQGKQVRCIADHVADWRGNGPVRRGDIGQVIGKFPVDGKSEFWFVEVRWNRKAEQWEGSDTQVVNALKCEQVLTRKVST